MNARLILGTRGSALALAQARLAADALRPLFPGIEPQTRVITTSGDRKHDLSLIRRTPSGAKGLFTKELEEALLSGEIDVAVHSCKDMPGEMPPELVLAAVLPRAATADILITRSPGTLADLPPGAVIGTSSVRRARQILWKRPDLATEEIRGNVQTRLRKLRESERLAGTVLAQAGLDRLGVQPGSGVIESEHGLFYTSPLEILPAIGQGAIALQTRRADAPRLAAVNHEPTWRAIRAERELMRLLAGDCNLPVGVASRLEGAELVLEAILFGAPGEPPREAAARGTEPEAVALALWRNL